MQLNCDRVRDQKGFFGGTLLWLDLLADAAVSIPREYRQASLDRERWGWEGRVSLVIATFFSVSGGFARIDRSGSLGSIQSGFRGSGRSPE